MTPTHVILKYNGQHASRFSREVFEEEWIKKCGFVEGQIYSVIRMGSYGPVVWCERFQDERVFQTNWVDASMPHFVEE